MRKIAKVTSLLTLIAIMIMGTMSVSAYDYKLTVSAGNGSFAEGAVITAEGSLTATTATNTDTVTVSGKDYTITTMPDGKSPAESKYFVRGLKLAGEDNDNNILSVNVLGTGGDARLHNQDVELVVAYGLKSAIVSYTISYEFGDQILGSDTFYGVAGDTVTVSPKYFAGYVPEAYSGIATLSADETENNFAFFYDEAPEGETTVITDDGVIRTVVVGGGGAAAAGGAGAGAAGAAPGTAIGDNATPTADQPATTVDLNDNNTPLEEGEPGSDATDVDDSSSPLANIPTAGKVAGAAAIIAAIAALVAVIAKRSAANADEDEEEDDE